MVAPVSQARELTKKGFIQVTTAFVMMGFTSTCWGAIVPYLSDTRDIPISTAGVLYGIFLFHTLLGTISVQLASRKKDLQFFVKGGIALTLIGFTGIFFSSSVVILALFAALGGFGYGATGITFLFLITRSANASHFRMNVVSAATGVGALAGPLSIAILGARNIPAIVITSITTSFITTWFLADAKWRFKPEKTGSFKKSRPWPLLLVIFGVIFYSGLENSIAAWLPTVAVNSGFTLETGTFFSSIFYALFTAGRFLGVWLSTRVEPEKIVVSMIAMALIPLMITWQSDQFPLITLVTAGLFLGPIFPNTSSWVARKTPDFPGGTTLLMLAIMGGGFAFPPAFGYLIEGKETSAFAGMILPLLILSVVFFYLGNRVWKSNTEVAEKD